MQKFIDPDHPFYRPLWRRLLIVGSCALWTAVEFWNGATTWGMIFLAVTAYTSATLIVFFKPKATTEVVAQETATDAEKPLSATSERSARDEPSA
ncbi:hypothetical protein ASG25_16310 [Rhizobium sp. Leaf384]|uniref:hypothetical protein n=1 Tax=unclassified Rhizobium TaxID=2613769 RepID=UPI0007152CCA|nr:MULTISPECIES: hypothetical protein [unclassified Rhizobium]KQR69181.1 hypothetical protein ASG03_08250 [Rhizobium sp. Leaf341]KQS76961.1 hypothetical protein ASG25_16310 [Rhizobium sp. Leaf384]KQS78232.1 hypothetical protein ASG58_07525 [Rhizobium sp. Leaf383]